MPAEVYDVAVIGAGFGGLGAALRLAELGARVIVCERLNYPGGCASTFQRRMRDTLAARVPESGRDRLRHELTPSPRTFERFTGRREGFVGGIPRRRGLRHYWSVLPPAPPPGCISSGTPCFPGRARWRRRWAV